MKYSRLALSILAVLAGLLMTAPALARPAARSVTIKHFVCSESGGKQWVTQNMLHLRGLDNSGQIVASDPRLAGRSVIVFNADVDATTMAGAGSGTVVFLPADERVHGVWQGTFKQHNPATPATRSGSAFLRGTDDLKGFELTVTIKGSLDLSDAPAACSRPTAADIMIVRIWRV